MTLSRRFDLIFFFVLEGPKAKDKSLFFVDNCLRYDCSISGRLYLIQYSYSSFQRRVFWRRIQVSLEMLRRQTMLLGRCKGLNGRKSLYFHEKYSLWLHSKREKVTKKVIKISDQSKNPKWRVSSYFHSSLSPNSSPCGGGGSKHCWELINPFLI